MKKMTPLLRRVPRLLTLAATLGAGTALAVNDLPGGPAVRQLNLHPPVTVIAEQQAWLHWFMLIVCVVIFVGVFGVMFYSILKHRKSLGHKAANFHESVGVEIAWTVVPLLIVIAMGAMATRTVVAMKDTCLLYTSDAADERSSVDLGGRRIIKKKKSGSHVETSRLHEE